MQKKQKVLPMQLQEAWVGMFKMARRRKRKRRNETKDLIGGVVKVAIGVQGLKLISKYT